MTCIALALASVGCSDDGDEPSGQPDDTDASTVDVDELGDSVVMAGIGQRLDDCDEGLCAATELMRLRLGDLTPQFLDRGYTFFDAAAVGDDLVVPTGVGGGTRHVEDWINDDAVARPEPILIGAAGVDNVGDELAWVVGAENPSDPGSVSFRVTAGPAATEVLAQPQAPEIAGPAALDDGRFAWLERRTDWTEAVLVVQSGEALVELPLPDIGYPDATLFSPTPTVDGSGNYVTYSTAFMAWPAASGSDKTVVLDTTTGQVVTTYAGWHSTAMLDDGVILLTRVVESGTEVGAAAIGNSDVSSLGIIEGWYFSPLAAVRQ